MDLMDNYPYFGLPNYMENCELKTNNSKKSSTTINDKISSKNISKISSDSENRSFYKVSSFNILGIDFYFDDLLIICIIFFLYSQNVKDYCLFVVLILLLFN